MYFWSFLKSFTDHYKMQYAVFQPMFMQRLHVISKCERLQERLTEERRVCKTQPDGINSDVNFHINSLREL